MKTGKKTGINDMICLVRAWGERLIIGITLATCSSLSFAQEQYRYKLEDNHDSDLCVHMTKVFNDKFRTPWNMGHYPENENPVIFGLYYTQLFERLPRVEFNINTIFDMLLSKFPSSSEFEAVHWQQGQVEYPNNQTLPTLIANLDLTNNGKKEWLVKYGFMRQIPQNEGMIRSDMGEEDKIALFPPDGFNPTKRLTDIELVRGQKADQKPRQLHVGNQMRPFIYKGKTYIAGYQQSWPQRDVFENLPDIPYQKYPDAEYMNIVKVLPDSEYQSAAIVIEEAKFEVVCTIRMIMQKENSNGKAR